MSNQYAIGFLRFKVVLGSDKLQNSMGVYKYQYFVSSQIVPFPIMLESRKP
jgi:hypothetical protein